MKALTALVRSQALLFLREPFAFFFTLVFPALLLLVFGFIFGNEPLAAWGLSFGYIDMQVPALAAIIIGSVALIGIPIATATMRETGVLRRYRATPLKPLVYVVADIAVQLAVSLVGMLILVILGKLIFGLRFGGSWLAVTAGFTLCALAFFAVGYLIASLSPGARVAQTIGMVCFFPMMFLSGAAMPRQIMPEKVRGVADLLPLTHVVSFLQGLWNGHSWSEHTTELVWLSVMLIVGTAISVRFFRWE